MSNGTINWQPGVTLDHIEEQVIKKAYAHFRGNKTATAVALGVAIRTLDSKFEQYEKEDQYRREKEELDRLRKVDHLLRARGKHPSQAPVVEAPISVVAQTTKLRSGKANG